MLSAFIKVNIFLFASFWTSQYLLVSKTKTNGQWITFQLYIQIDIIRNTSQVVSQILIKEVFEQSLWVNRETNTFFYFLQCLAQHQSLFSYLHSVNVLTGSTQIVCNKLGLHNPQYVVTLYASPLPRYLRVVEQSQPFQT